MTDMLIEPFKFISLNSDLETETKKLEKINTNNDSVFCKVCGRPLKDTNSRAIGMGPCCYQRFLAHKYKQVDLFCHINKTNNGTK